MTTPLKVGIIKGQGSTVAPPSKGHFRIDHFVLNREVIIFSEVKNVLMLWGRGPNEHPLLGGCPLSENVISVSDDHTIKVGIIKGHPQFY